MTWKIYKYTNKITGQCYIGQTSMEVHQRAGKNGSKYRSAPFHNAIQQYGWNSFEQSVLKLCDTQEEADYYEKLFIEKYNTLVPNGYNILSGGKGVGRGGLTGENHPMYGIHRYGSDNPMYGKHHNQESNRKNSESHKGKPNVNKGKKTGPLSEETKKKISESLQGRFVPDTTRKKISDYLKGKPNVNKGRKWYNNGIISIRAFNCPEGYLPGRLVKQKCNDTTKSA